MIVLTKETHIPHNVGSNKKAATFDMAGMRIVNNLPMQQEAGKGRNA
jgi:hypothetical protein